MNGIKHGMAFLRRRLSARSRPVVEFSGHALGTTYKIAGIGCAADKKVIQRMIERDLTRVDALMSTYRDDSEVGRLNRTTNGDWHKISTETVFVIQQAIDIGRRSGGSFDITVGALTNLWGFGPDKRRFALPSRDQISVALSHSGLDKLEVELAPPAIRKHQSQLQVDLSGIAKGFAVDLIAQNLTRFGVKDYCVEVGGEIRVVGHNAHALPWHIAIERPETGRAAVDHTLTLTSGAVATSGDWRQYFETDGIRYSHTIDPRSGFPIRHALASVTVIDRTCTRADAWATALLVKGPEAGLQLAEAENLAALFVIRTASSFEKRCSSQFVLMEQNGRANGMELT